MTLGPAERYMRGSDWAVSSAGEHILDMDGVTGSIPVPPTILIKGLARRRSRRAHVSPMKSRSFRTTSFNSLRITHPQDPAFNSRQREFGRSEVRHQESRESAISVSVEQPSGNAECIVLMAVAIAALKFAAPQCRIDLSNSRLALWDVPAVERPEMHAAAELLANVAQPGDTGVARFCHRSLNVEMKD